MRISSSYFNSRLASQMMASQTRLASIQEQLASGMRVIRPSDDPVGTGQAILLREAQAQLEQHQRSSERAELVLSSEESTLASIGELIVGIRSLALQSNNDTLGDAEKATLLTELTAQKDNLLSLVNATDVNGNYLFAGSRVDTKPWPTGSASDYQGDAIKNAVDIGPGNTIELGTSGGELMNFSHTDQSGTTSTANLFDTIETLETQLAMPLTDDAARVGYHDALADVIDVLTSAQANISLYRSSAGSALAEIDRARESNSESSFQVQAELAGIVDLDYAEAITQMESELASLEALQASYSRMQTLSLFSRL